MIRQNGQKFINFELVHINKFAITSNFNLANDVMAVIKNIEGVSYDDRNKAWIVPVEYYKEVLINI